MSGYATAPRVGHGDDHQLNYFDYCSPCVVAVDAPPINSGSAVTFGDVIAMEGAPRTSPPSHRAAGPRQGESSY